MIRRLRRLRLARARDEQGYVSILVASFLASGLFVACVAISVDTANWFYEAEKVQRAADAAALGGVPFLPHDLPAARQRALEIAARNGFDDADDGVQVEVSLGDRASRLRVVISSRTRNHFGASFGATSAVISREAVTDYQGPSPMGSPCPTFGNEPPPGTGAASPGTPSALGGSPFANCSSSPSFWGTVEGPETGKVQGDRYQTLGCEVDDVDGCTDRDNDEYDEFGYVFLVKVQESAVGSPIDLQLYDPMFANTGQFCDLLPSRSRFDSSDELVNPYTTHRDARDRYSRNGGATDDFCTGDSFPGGSPDTPPTTSFVLREQVDSQAPREAPVQDDTSGRPCIKQFDGATPDRSGYGFDDWDDRWFKEGSDAYVDDLAELFHNWTSLCTFTPSRAGDYYLQVRSNVSLGGTTTDNDWVRRGNAAAAAETGNTESGGGSNSFALRAVTSPGLEREVAVSGYNHMPIFINTDAATATFNLVRVLPGVAGQQVAFRYFDAGDAQESGSVRVLPPTDATGSITSDPFPGGCTTVGGSASSETSISDCTAPILEAWSGDSSRNNGKTQTIRIPIPGDYTCDYESPAGCWYRVEMSFGSGSVHDVTTWDAEVLGDPVRLVQ